MSRATAKLAVLSLLVLFVGCSSNGLNCSGCAGGCGGNPNFAYKGPIVGDGVLARMTQPGVDFLTANLKPIIESTLKGGFDCSGPGLPIPDQVFGNGPKDKSGNYEKPTGNNCGTSYKVHKIFCSGSTPSSTWFYAKMKRASVCGTLASNSIKVQLDEASNEVRVAFSLQQVQVRAQEPDVAACFKAKVNTSFVGGQACGGVTMGLSDTRFVLDNLAGTIRMKFSADPKTGKVGLKVVAPGGVKFSSNTKLSLKFGQCKKNLEIILAKVPIINRTIKLPLPASFCTTIVQGIEGLANLTKAIQPLVFSVLGLAVEQMIKQTDLLGVAKVQMELPMAGLIGGLLPGGSDARPLGLSIAPGKKVGISQGGLNLGMNAGFDSTPNHTCVPKRNPPNLVPGPAPSLSGSYHMAASISRAAANLAGWGFYHTGALCLSIDSAAVGSLAGGSFKLNAGFLTLLVPNITSVVDSQAPVMIRMHPMQSPRLDFGTGAKSPGKPTDSTIKVAVDDMVLEFYVWFHDRWIRLFDLSTDLKLGLSLIPAPGNVLEIAFDTDSIALANPRVNGTYLMKTADLAKLLPVMVSMLVKMLGNQQLKFPLDISKQLSATLGVGVTMRIDGVRRDGAQNDWLSVLISLGCAGGKAPPCPKAPPSPVSLAVATTASLVPGDPGTFRRDAAGKPIPTGEVLLNVGGYPEGERLEFQYRVDFGPWTSFHSGPILRVKDPILKILGHHTIWVRAQVAGQYETRDPWGTKVKLLIDPLPPTVAVLAQGDELKVVARDIVTPRDRLALEYRVGSGPWLPIKDGRIRRSELVGGVREVEVRVRDEAGNSTKVTGTLRPKSAAGAAAPKPAAGGSGAPGTGLPTGAGTGCACRAEGGDDSGTRSMGWILLVLAGFGLVRRKG